MTDDLEYRIGKLVLKPGNVVVVKVDREISGVTATLLRDQVMKMLPKDVQVLVITKDIELSVIESSGDLPVAHASSSTDQPR